MPMMHLSLRYVGLLLWAYNIAVAVSLPRTATLYVQPANANNKPAVLAQIAYDPDTLEFSVISYSPPKLSSRPEELVRVGPGDSKSGIIGYTAIRAASLAEDVRKTVVLHLDSKGEVYQSALYASKTKGSEEITDKDLQVKLVPASKAPKPGLDKPVVLTEDGRIPEPEPEKTFLQR